MSEEDAQYSYVETEVLIDSARVLSSTFPSIGVVLTGNELEILRNMLNYATRRRTFVGTYHNNYYLVADDDDWLDIENIVAELEEKLMGNGNAIWGYADRLFTREDNTTLVSGSWEQTHDTVPSGEIWRVKSISIFSDIASGTCAVLAYLPAVSTQVVDLITVIANRFIVINGLDWVLKEGDGLRFSWAGLAGSQRLISNVIGYRMNV